MADPADVTKQLDEIIDALDPKDYGVAIAHLRDAVDAMRAVQTGEVTKFALHERLIRGQVTAKPLRRNFR